MAVTVEEKLEIAGELGLEKQRWILAARQEADSLTGLKFKPITRSQIHWLLFSNLHKSWAGIRNMYGLNVVVSIAICLSIGFIMTGIISMLEKQFSFYPLLLSLGAGIFAGVLKSVMEFDVRMDTPHDWSFELPYGALCAMKEAAAAGLSGFAIYYPSEVSEIDKDPVITARRPHTVERLVFFWDEGLIYREQR